MAWELLAHSSALLQSCLCALLFFRPQNISNCIVPRMRILHQQEHYKRPTQSLILTVPGKIHSFTTAARVSADLSWTATRNALPVPPSMSPYIHRPCTCPPWCFLFHILPSSIATVYPSPPNISDLFCTNCIITSLQNWIQSIHVFALFLSNVLGRQFTFAEPRCVSLTSCAHTTLHSWSFPAPPSEFVNCAFVLATEHFFVTLWALHLTFQQSTLLKEFHYLSVVSK